MTHDHSFQLFSLLNSKIQTQTNCKEVWPCSTQCIFHCLGGDDTIIYLIHGSMRWESPPSHAELRTCLSMRVWRMAWATSKVVTKLCLEQELEQSTKIERIHQDLHKIQVYSSRGLRFIWPLHCKKTRKPNPNWPLPWQSIRCYMPRSQFLCHLSCLLEIDWSNVDIDLGILWHKASRSIWTFEPFYQFILLFATTVLSLQKILTWSCQTRVPQSIRGTYLDSSELGSSLAEAVLGFPRCQQSLESDSLANPGSNSVFPAKPNMANEEHIQVRKKNHARHQLPPHHSMHVGDKSNDKGLHIFCGKGFWTNLTTTSGWRAPALLATEGKPNCSELVWYSIQLYI